MLVLHQTDENGRQQREDIGLQKRDQQLETEHEQDEHYGAAGDEPVREHEDQADQREDHEVSGGHVREQPQAEREWFHDFADQLYGGHDDRHDHRPDALHPRRDHHDRLEIAFGAERTESRDL